MPTLQGKVPFMTPGYRIPFTEMPGDFPAPFVTAKAAIAGSHKLRLVEFQHGFEEPDWCRQGHTGYVIEGRLQVTFPGGTVVLEAGDGLHIPVGDAHRHKAAPLTARARLVLFDPL